MVSFTPRPLYPWGKGPRTCLVGGSVGTTEGVDAVEKRKIFYLFRESNPDSSVVNSIAQRLYFK
jgi:hypothetical protein